LENRRAQNYEKLGNNLLQSYQKLDCNMSLKIQFLHSHLDFFAEKTRRTFPSDISSMEKRYQGKWNCTMLANYCWTLASDVPTMEYKRQAKIKKKVLNNKLTRRRLCRCSIYVVNIIPKQDKSIKHILFH
jgi:hypothetical protein